jgi:peptide/nickel transport system substrate-binding protein
MNRFVWLLPAAATIAALACAAPTPGPTSGQTGSGQPHSGGVLNVRIPDDPGGWDLSLFKAYPAWEGHTLAENSLLGFQSGPDIEWSKQIMRPELAEKWEVSPDGKAFTFYLRKAVKYQNLPPVNGRELTSADVKWTYEYASRTGQFKDKKLIQGQYEWMFEGIQAVETPDPYTVVVKFQEPFVPFLNYAASDSTPITPHEIFDQKGNLMDLVIGTGPFQLDQATSQPASRWNWRKNASFWEPGKPYLDGINWLVIKDDASSYAAFKTKQLDYLGNSNIALPPDDLEQMKKAVPGLGINQHPNDTAWHLYLNVRQGKPLSDVRLRKAINLALDRDEFIKVMQAAPRWAFASALPDTFSAEEVKQLLSVDPEQAKRLVVEAGYPNGLEMDMHFPGNDYGQAYVTGIQLFQAQMKKVGINVNLKSVSKDDYSNRKKVADYTIVAQDSSSLEGDLDSLLFAGFHSKSKKAYPGAADPKLDQMLEAQRKEVDPAKRQQIIRDIVKYIHVDQVYDIGAFYRVQAEVWQPYVKGLSSNVQTRGIYPADAWLDK